MLTGQINIADGEHALNGEIPVLVGRGFFHQFLVGLVGIPIFGEVFQHLPGFVQGFSLVEVVGILFGKILVDFKSLIKIFDGVSVGFAPSFVGLFAEPVGFFASLLS